MWLYFILLMSRPAAQRPMEQYRATLRRSRVCGFHAQAGKSQHESLADDAHTGTGSEGHTGSEGLDESQMTIVKNTPSMSPRFRGFDFKAIPRRRP